MLDVEDLSPEQTTSFVDHCLQQPEGSAPAARWSVAAALQRRVSSKRCSSAEDPASPTKPRAGDGFSGRPARSRSEVPAALAEFAYDVTGGSPRGVLELLSEMERQQLLVPAGAGHLSLAKGCADARWLQDNMRPPQSLLARAFARFERLGPKQQAVLKVASSLERSFSVAELQAALGDLSAEESRGANCTPAPLLAGPILGTGGPASLRRARGARVAGPAPAAAAPPGRPGAHGGRPAVVSSSAPGAEEGLAARQHRRRAPLSGGLGRGERLADARPPGERHGRAGRGGRARRQAAQRGPARLPGGSAADGPQVGRGRALRVLLGCAPQRGLQLGLGVPAVAHHPAHEPAGRTTRRYLLVRGLDGGVFLRTRRRQR
ncbi:unnamed protein product [Prorocentrum cordatum]|uniref:Uncharacterized protein n=1 Tax=Prorocentrum cordatum TaxID=2364126 RepID=A0ABN9PV08_9DINO|nr:unnamed protein product [Polarella glacialis]